MVSTRRSTGKYIEVELSDNGKNLQKVIPIEEQRAIIEKEIQQEEQEQEEEELRLRRKTRKKKIPTPPVPIKKKETRGRKRKIINQPDSNSSSDTNSTASPSIPKKKIETRGRKRKNPDHDSSLSSSSSSSSVPPSSTLKKIHIEQNLITPLTNNNTNLPPSTNSNKHKINHLLTSDSPPLPPLNHHEQITTTNLLPQRQIPTNLITIPAPHLLNTPTPKKPVLPSPPTTTNGSNSSPLLITPSSSSSSSTSATTNNNNILSTDNQNLSLSASNSGGRIPITSIISQKIDHDNIPFMIDNEDDLSDKKTKRRYKVDRDNIKINKRIMSQDTENVIKMFKKFDDEVLTNPEARSRLLNLGFETRKRYITTFKHYIRFCCKKNLQHFFVTGELMREFYEEQFALSNSNKPVIRLRKMDPAFSKLQEINYIVYGLKSKDIPNRNLAVEYLTYKELGQDPPPIEHYNLNASIGSPLPENPIPVTSRQNNSFIPLKAGHHHHYHHPSTPQPPETAPPTLAILQQTQNQGILRVSSAVKSNNQSTVLSTPVGKPDAKKTKKAASTRSHNNGDQYFPSSSLINFQSNNGNYISEILRTSFMKLKQDIDASLRQNVSINPTLISTLATNINTSLDEFEIQLIEPVTQNNEVVEPKKRGRGRPRQAREPSSQPPPPPSQRNVPVFDMNNKIRTVYEIIEEWYKHEPSIATRLEKWGEDWIRDSIDHNTFLERKNVIEFVEKMSNESN
ncbi:hypothetical protein G210_1110 [Candida maltosa Xu316]|uniref:Transcription activator GCR1-like domain-containing protein n=1 Tax=Candida maltosa (strain Xu316) TaxID=1245528 RepID=M3IPF8_CANMX|nr:hypothetical protein G210_1110 [Candida maltosa Xu316]